MNEGGIELVHSKLWVIGVVHAILELAIQRCLAGRYPARGVLSAGTSETDDVATLAQPRKNGAIGVVHDGIASAAERVEFRRRLDVIVCPASRNHAGAVVADACCRHVFPCL